MLTTLSEASFHEDVMVSYEEGDIPEEEDSKIVQADAEAINDGPTPLGEIREIAHIVFAGITTVILNDQLHQRKTFTSQEFLFSEVASVQHSGLSMSDFSRHRQRLGGK